MAGIMKRKSLSGRAALELSVHQCVSSAIRCELPTIARRALSTEVDLDEVPGEPATSSSQRAIHEFVHRLIESLRPQSQVSITLVNGICQWELEIAGEFEGFDSQDRTLLPRAFNPARDRACQELRRLAFECGGEVEQWDCPQGGSAIVLVVAKSNAAGHAA